MDVAPRGAFYVFPDVSGLYGRSHDGKVLETSSDVAAAVLESEAVAMVPGSAFGAPNGMRMSYAASMDDLNKALERLARFIAGLS